MGKARFHIYRAKDNHFYYRLYADDLYVILDGEADREAYMFEEDCRNTINNIKKSAAKDEHYRREIAMEDEYYFVLVDENEEILAVSDLYPTEIERECAIALFKQIAPSVPVEHIPCIFESNMLH